MNKIFTLLLSAAFCATSPVLAMDPPPEIQQEVPLSSRKTLKIKAHPAYVQKELLPILAYTEGPSSSPLFIHTSAIDDEFLAMLEKDLESNNHPIGLTLENLSSVHSSNLTAKGVVSLAHIIEKYNLEILQLHPFKRDTLCYAPKLLLLLECLAVCPHVKQATFIYDNSSDYPMESYHCVLFSVKFPSLEKLTLTMDLPDIEFLNRSSPHFPDREPTFSQLKDLDLSSCKLKDQGFIALSHLKKLHTLNLEDNRITERSIPLIDCPNLTDLNLASNALENSGALTAGQCFSKLSKLEKLNLNKNGRIYANGILALVKLTQLKELQVLRNGMNNEEANVLITALPEVLRTGVNPENSRHLTIRVETAPLLTFSDGINNTVEIKR